MKRWMIFALLFQCLLQSFEVIAKDQGAIVFIIDTLDAGKALPSTPLLRYSEFYTEFDNPLLGGNQFIAKKTFPNVCITIADARIQDSVDLLVDSNGGKVRINGLARLVDDTIKINRWKLYNFAYDTILTQTFYLRVYNDSIVRTPFRIKTKITGHHSSKRKYPLSILTVTINGKETNIPLHVGTSGGPIKSFMGYKPYKRYIRYMKHNANTCKKFKYTYFYGRTYKYNTTFNGTLQL